MMTQEELEVLEKTLIWANGCFTDYCELADTFVYEQDEINSIEDDETREKAQENRDFEDLLTKAQKIIEKYKKED